MAVKATPTTSSLLQKLEEQLTCVVCLDLYTNPKTLPCLHSLCEQCLEGLPLDLQGGTHFVTCPTCRHSTKLPEPEGAAGFPVAFHLNQLKEFYSIMKKVSDPQQVVTCDNCSEAIAICYCKECSKFFCQECKGVHKNWAPTANHQVTSLDEMATSPSQLLPAKQEATFTCATHHKPLEIFCETCDQVICQHCTVRIHRNHEYDLVSDSYHKYCLTLESCLNPVKKKVDAMKNVLTALTEQENEIRVQGVAIKEEINAMVEEMINILRQSGNQLTEAVDTVTNGKLQVLSEQKKSAEISLGDAKYCEDYVEQSLKMCSPEQILMSKKQMLERMSQVTHQINVEEFNPKEKANIRLIKDSEAIQALHHIGDIVSYSSTALQQCKVKTAEVEHLPEKKMVSFPLSIELSAFSLLTVPLSSLSCSILPDDASQPIATTVISTTHPAVYTVQCNTSTRGLHQVNVQVDDVQLEATSLEIPYLNSLVQTTVGDLNCPWGVAANQEDRVIIVTECLGHCVTVLDGEGKKVKSFGGEGGSGNVKLSYPRGVAITPDNSILVTDNHRLQKISMNGELIASVTGYGTSSEPLLFKEPAGIAISPVTGRIYVVDHYNDLIHIFTPELNFFDSFGKEEGSGEGQFCKPWNIAIDSQDILYVADRGNHRIQKFTPEGKFLAQFDAGSSGPGQLNHPYGIAIDSADLVYVTENFNRVTVFTSDGQFVRTFGEEGNQLNDPLGITFNKGVLYVCDAVNNRLVVY